MAKQPVKQKDNKGNKSPKSTFADRPNDINRNGRPPKEHSLTDLLKETLNQPYNETGKTKKQQVIDKLFEIAVDKEDVQMMKYLIDRVDGKPLQTIEAALEHSEIDMSRYTKEELKQLAELSRKNRS